MSANDIKRAKIFTVYSKHLQFIEQAGLIEGLRLHFDETYICPLCLQQFSRVSLDQNLPNPLTLEDVPPQSLGGRADILTCFECNNQAGTKFDHHLTEGLKQYDNSRLLPNTKFPVTINYGAHKVQGEVIVSAEGNPSMLHKPNRNPPGKLDSYIAEVNSNSIINYSLRSTKKLDTRLFTLAILKIGYLLTFKTYGYTFLFDPVYDIIRKQLRNPNLELWPTDLWCQPPAATLIPTASMIVERNAKVILPFFPLKTENSINHFGVFIPFPGHNVISSVKNLRAKKGLLDLAMWAPPISVNSLEQVAYIKQAIDFHSNNV